MRYLKIEPSDPPDRSGEEWLAVYARNRDAWLTFLSALPPPPRPRCAHSDVYAEVLDGREVFEKHGGKEVVRVRMARTICKACSWTVAVLSRQIFR